jgi:glycosyltransferase involved in cell wall biosynthesis
VIRRSGIEERALVVVTSSFPIRVDGSEAAGSFVADLVNALAERIPVRVVAPGLKAEAEQWSDRVQVFRYAAPSRPLSTLKPWNPIHMFWIARVLRGGMTATRAALANNPGHVFALWGLPCGEWARRAARERNVDYSVWLLGSDVWSLGRVAGLRGLLSRVIRNAKNAYADGYRLAEEARKISNREIDFLPSTREVSSAGESAPRAVPPFRLLFLGRWHPNKGADLLIDALDMLDDADWARIDRIEIQGGGPLETRLRRRVADLRARGRPVEAGRFLNKSEAVSAIARADWVLIPSRIESIPVVFSDAMKLGRPVVSTPVGDLPRLLADFPVGVCAGAVSAPAFADALRVALQTSPAGRAAALAQAAEPFSLQRSIVPRILAGISSGAGA